MTWTLAKYEKQNSWLKMTPLPSSLFTQTTNTLAFTGNLSLTIAVTALESTQTFRPTMPKLS